MSLLYPGLSTKAANCFRKLLKKLLAYQAKPYRIISNDKAARPYLQKLPKKKFARLAREAERAFSKKMNLPIQN
jgi:hypothetical protein